MPIDVSASTFQADVIERSKSVAVVLDFWAPWCGPCRTLGPVLEKLAAAAGGAWVLAKLNTDDNQGLAQRYQIQGIPAVKAFVNGVVVDEFVGSLPEAQVRAWLAKVVPDEATLLVRKATAARDAGDIATATMLYDDALRIDAHQPDALLFAVHVAMDRGEREAAIRLFGQVRPQDRAAHAAAVATLSFRLDAKPDAAERYAASATVENTYEYGVSLAAAGRWPEALAQFFDVVCRDRTFRTDAGRKAMIEVFDAVGQGSPLADAFRRKLSGELFK